MARKSSPDKTVAEALITKGSVFALAVLGFLGGFIYAVVSCNAAIARDYAITNCTVEAVEYNGAKKCCEFVVAPLPDGTNASYEICSVYKYENYARVHCEEVLNNTYTCWVALDDTTKAWNSDPRQCWTLSYALGASCLAMLVLGVTMVLLSAWGKPWTDPKGPRTCQRKAKSVAASSAEEGEVGGGGGGGVQPNKRSFFARLFSSPSKPRAIDDGL